MTATVEQPPESILFVSCDIVGSTHFKQNRPLDWQEVFLAFYRQFPQKLASVQAECADASSFTLWKGIGDELLFTCPVRDEEAVYRAVRVWLAAMSSYEQDSLAKLDLATKGGAFVATIPAPDRKSSIPRDPSIEMSDKDLVVLNEEAIELDDHNKYQYDFFGPSIDTGFRVISASSNRFFTLSVEVAWCLQRCTHDALHDDAQEFDIADLNLMDTVSLKGVWGNRSYPIFAIDRHAKDPVNLAMREIQGAFSSSEQIGAVCKACLESEGWPSRLFLPDSNFAPFRVPPPDPTLDDNQMEGAETVPVDEPGTPGDALATDPPMA